MHGAACEYVIDLHWCVCVFVCVCVCAVQRRSSVVLREVQWISTTWTETGEILNQ